MTIRNQQQRSVKVHSTKCSNSKRSSTNVADFLLMTRRKITVSMTQTITSRKQDENFLSRWKNLWRTQFRCQWRLLRWRLLYRLYKNIIPMTATAIGTLSIVRICARPLIALTRTIEFNIFRRIESQNRRNRRNRRNRQESFLARILLEFTQVRSKTANSKNSEKNCESRVPLGKESVFGVFSGGGRGTPDDFQNSPKKREAKK